MFVHVALGVDVLAAKLPAFESVRLCPPQVPIALEAILGAVTVWSCAAYTARFAPYLKMSCARGGKRD